MQCLHGREDIVVISVLIRNKFTLMEENWGGVEEENLMGRKGM